MMVCPQCGNQNPAGAMFCDNCGSGLAGAAMPGGGSLPQAGPTVPAGGGSACPQCGASVMAGQLYCEDCGFALGSTPGPPPPTQPPQPHGPVVPPPPAPGPVAPPPTYTPPVYPGGPPPTPAPPAMAQARLVEAGGAQIQLAGKTEYIMGREDVASSHFPEVNLEPYGAAPSGVSRRHARIIFQDGYFLEDLESVNGTFLNKQKLLPRQPMPLKNGDEIRLGKLVLMFYTG
jgi:hypothetical protein